MNEINKSNHILYLDLARAIAMIWIVGYWHFHDYLNIFYKTPWTLNWFDHHITRICLGLFMFLSGYFLSKYKFNTFWTDLKSFYIKRFKRFYVLYALSVFCLFLVGFNPGRFCLITSLTGISTYLLPQPYTLWFISMLMSFYIITPFILASKSNMWVVPLSFFVIATALNYLIPSGIDKRFFWCFPLYIMGLVIGRFFSLDKIIGNHLLCIMSIFATTFFVLLTFKNKNWFCNIIIIPCGILGSIYCCKQLIKLPIKYIVQKIAYCSMSAYLFHREIYLFLGKIYHKFLGWVDLNYAIMIIIILPICLIISFLIQYFYDKMIMPKLLTSRIDT